MFRKSDKKKAQHTNPDHRPMLPEFRGPHNMLDHHVRCARKRYEELNPNEKINWR